MRLLPSSVVALFIGAGIASAQSGPTVPPPTPVPDVTSLVSRLSLERYKATIKGLTEFGDRRQGTERNRKAVDWIEAQLKSYGCPTERVRYEFNPPPPSPRAGGRRPQERDPNAIERSVGGGRPRGSRART
ncbi:MAG: peptidase M28, partial [Acidobacteriota bacterium]|nr:peptidase M28 [Acidobacteriota bacterium]